MVSLACQPEKSSRPLPFRSVPSCMTGAYRLPLSRWGETFARRELELGVQQDDFVQVRAGLSAGERVVTRGAYRVHLASLSSTLPEHDHAH